MIWSRLGNLRRYWITRDDHKRTTREVFSRIYEKQVWGGDNSNYSSGSGSRESHIVEPYIDTIQKWVSEQQKQDCTVLDLGCGDFHVGGRLHHLFSKYIAADIVPDLIDHHRHKYHSSNLEFICIDAIDEPLPNDASVVFLRQVLQHLSNDQILKILPKLRNYKDVIITEHLPLDSPGVIYNIDKRHGGGIRLNDNSGVELQLPPFNLIASSATVLLEVPASLGRKKDGIIRTTWYQL